MNDDFGGQEALTASETHWRYGAPTNTRSKCLLLTTQKIAIIAGIEDTFYHGNKMSAPR